MLFGSALKRQLPTREQALPGRPTRPYAVSPTHAVLGTPMFGPWPEGTQVAYFALGCFWGEEKKFWETPGVVTTAVGYQGGYTPNPTYEETCTGKTGHAETVLVAYDPSKVTIERAAQGVLGGPRPDPGHAPGQRRRHDLPLGVLLHDAGAEGGLRGQPRRRTRMCCGATGSATSRPSCGRRRTPASSTTPRTTTSSTCTRSRGATAAPAAPACRARWASPRPPTDHRLTPADQARTPMG